MLTELYFEYDYILIDLSGSNDFLLHPPTVDLTRPSQAVSFLTSEQATERAVWSAQQYFYCLSKTVPPPSSYGGFIAVL
jgi:hypothetical protein